MPALLASLIAELIAIVSGATLSCLISRTSSNDCLHCAPYSQALIAALKAIVSGATQSCLISRMSSNACPLRALRTSLTLR